MQVISELIVNIFSWCRNNIGDTAAILSVLLVVWELRKTKLNNYLLNMDLLRKEESQVRIMMNEAKEEIKRLTKELKKKPTINRERFFELYGSDEYKHIRKIGYFYEYLGLIVRKKSIPFPMIFSLFSFPDVFWNRTAEIRKIICEEIDIDDFWINFGYLQKKYQKERRIRRYIGKRTGHGAKKKSSHTKE